MANGDGPTVEDIKFKSLNDSVSHMDGRINNIYTELADQKAWRMEIGSDVASMKTMLTGFSETQKMNAPSKTSWVAAVLLGVTLLGAVNVFVQQELGSIKAVEQLKNTSLLREVDMLREYNSLAVSKADEHSIISGKRGVAIGRLEYAVSSLEKNVLRVEQRVDALSTKVGGNSENIAADKTYTTTLKEKIYRGEG